MTEPIDFERELDRWFEDGPSDVADRVIDAALLQIETTSQRPAVLGLPGRIKIMPSAQRLVALAAVVVVAVVGLWFLLPGGRPGGSGSQPSPSATPSPTTSQSPGASSSGALDTAAWERITSPRYGYEAAYPKAWGHYPSTAFWTVPEPDGDLSPMLDVFSGGDPNETWAASSMKVPVGMTNGAWTDLYRQGQIDPSKPAACYPPPAAWSLTTIDGRAAATRVGCGELEAIAFVDGRVYSFGGWTSGVTTTPGVPDDFRARFDAWLTTITLDPASALEPPAASPSPGSSPSPSSS